MMKPTPLTPEDVARALDIQSQVLYIDASSTTMYWVLGELCLEVQKKKLWKALDAASFTQWLKTKLGKSRSTVMSAIRSVKLLTGLGVESEQLRQIPRANAELLCRLTESGRRDWIALAVTETPHDFKKMVEGTLSELEKEEKKKRIVIVPTVTQFEIYRQAFATVSQREYEGEPVSRERAFEVMAINYIQDMEQLGKLEDIRQEDDGA